MRRLFVILSVVCVVSGSAAAETFLEKIDRMHEEEQHQANASLLEDAIASTTNATEKAELYWRLARTTLELGDLVEQNGGDQKDVLDTFLLGEEHADKAIDLNPESYWSYYWKSANIGRWGETKGILNSLFKAKPMRDLLNQAIEIYPEHPDSFYVLGIMYRKVPGFPISFGNKSRAVSLGRKAVDAQRAEVESGKADEIKISYYMELARSLKERNWSASKRRREQGKMANSFEKERSVLDKNFFYEGVVDIPDKSDEEEALEMMRWVISEFQKKPVLKNSDRVDLEESQADLADWTK